MVVFQSGSKVHVKDDGMRGDLIRSRIMRLAIRVAYSLQDGRKFRPLLPLKNAEEQGTALWSTVQKHAKGSRILVIEKVSSTGWIMGRLPRPCLPYVRIPRHLNNSYINSYSFRGRCARMGHPLKLPSPTKFHRLGHFPPASQTRRLAGPVFYVQYMQWWAIFQSDTVPLTELSAT